MSIFTDIKELAEGRSQSKEWYRSQLTYGLESYSGGFEPGDIIFFSYAAATEKLPFYDRFPMVRITDRSMNTGHFEGGNLHYLRPSARRAVANAWAVGGAGYPRRCHHKYFMSNVNNAYKVNPIDLQNMTPLPVEQFVFNAMGRRIDVPSSFIWSRV